MLSLYLLIPKPATGADNALTWTSKVSSYPALQLQTEISVDFQAISVLEAKLLLTVKVTLCFIQTPGKQDQDLFYEMTHCSHAFLAQYK